MLETQLSTGAGDMRALILWKGPLPWSPGTQGNLTYGPTGQRQQSRHCAWGEGAEGTQPAFDKVAGAHGRLLRREGQGPRLLRNCRDKGDQSVLQNKETCMFN